MGKFPPVPVKSTTCVLLGAGELSVIVIWAVRVPTALGVKVTVIVHWTQGSHGAHRTYCSAKNQWRRRP